MRVKIRMEIRIWSKMIKGECGDDKTGMTVKIGER